MRKIFINDTHQTEFEKKGYIIADFFLDQDEIELLKNTYDTLFSASPFTFDSTLFQEKTEAKRKADVVIQGIVGLKIPAYLLNYKTAIGNYVVKHPGDNGSVYPHQDWTLVDENEYRALNVWIPLVDVNEQNGAIFLHSHYHLTPAAYRGTNIPNACELGLDFIDEGMTLIPMKAGQAIIYDTRLIHASKANTSDRIRYACATACIPEETDLVHYSFKPDDTIQKYIIDSSFFHEYVYHATQPNTIPAKYLPVATLPYTTQTAQKTSLIPHTTKPKFAERLKRLLKM